MFQQTDQGPRPQNMLRQKSLGFRAMGMNMKEHFLGVIFAAVLMTALPALAQDGAIKIINEDGSVTEFKIPKNEDAMRRTPQPPPEPEPEMEAQAPVPVEAEELRPPARPRDFLGRVLGYEGKKDAPAPVKEEIVEEAAPEPVKEKSRKKDVAKAVEAQRALPYPAHKPATPKGYEQEPPPAPDALISQNAAVGIAIKHAPPASDFKVFRAMHNSRPVYSIVFKTDYGDREVLVDAFTGDVVKKK